MHNSVLRWESFLGEWGTATKSGRTRRASNSQHIFLRQWFGPVFRYGQYELRGCDGDLSPRSRSRGRAHRQRRLWQMVDYGMLNHRVDGGNCALAISATTRTPRTVRRNVRVVHSRVAHNMAAVHDSHKAKQVQPGKDRRE